MTATRNVTRPDPRPSPRVPCDLRDLRSAWAAAVLVVDNGSTDRTGEVARAEGASVITEGRRGYGSACLRGIESLASGAGRPPELVVFLEADYSDHPEALPDLLQPILDGQCDLVLESPLAGRRVSGAMPPESVWRNRLACVLMRLLFGVHYTDLGPFRAIRREALERLGTCDPDFGWTIDMQIKAARRALRVREVPVSFRASLGVGCAACRRGESGKRGGRPIQGHASDPGRVIVFRAILLISRPIQEIDNLSLSLGRASAVVGPEPVRGWK